MEPHEQHQEWDPSQTVYDGQFKRWDPLLGEVWDCHSLIATYARNMLINRTVEELEEIAQVIANFIIKYRGVYRREEFEMEVNFEYPLSLRLDGFPDRIGDSNALILKEVIKNRKMNEAEFHGWCVHELFAVMALWNIADCAEYGKKIIMVNPEAGDTLINRESLSFHRWLRAGLRAMESVCFAKFIRDQGDDMLKESNQELVKEECESRKALEQSNIISNEMARRGRKGLDSRYNVNRKIKEWVRNRFAQGKYKSIQRAAAAIYPEMEAYAKEVLLEEGISCKLVKPSTFKLWLYQFNSELSVIPKSGERRKKRAGL